MAHRIPTTALAALTFDLTAGSGEIQLLPDGAFRAGDGSGRPAEVDAWHIDAEIARALLARLAARPKDLLIDYEHQTLLKEKNGQPAPAAGWQSPVDIVYRPGAGVFAVNPKWTERAASLIAADEYRYISPVISYDTTNGAVLDIRMFALTNDPGITEMAQVALTALSASHDFLTEEEPHVNETLKKLLAQLGLSDKASEAEALGAVAALSAKAGEVAGLTEKVATLSAQAPDPAKYVPVATMQALQTEVAALTTSINADKVDKIVEAALTAGKLLPAQKEWAIDLGKSNLAALTAYVEKTPANPALVAMQSGSNTPAGAGQRDVALTATDEKVMAQLGVTKDDYLANR